MNNHHLSQVRRLFGSIRIGLALCCVSLSYGAEYYDVTDLGLPAKAEPTRILLNDSGFVAGGYILHLDAPIWNGSSWTSSPTYGYVWSEGVLTTLPLPEGAQNIGIEAISNAGILGSFYDGAWNKHYFTYQDSTLTMLTPAEATSSSATSINANGDVIGAYYGAGGQSRAFVFHGGSLVDLTPAGAVSSQAIMMNAAGQVAGYYYDGSGHTHAFLWTNGMRADLSVPEGTTDSFATAINATGQVAGSYKPASGQQRACIWTNGVLMDVGIPQGAMAASPKSINDAGELAGSCWGFNGGDYHLRGFVWRANEFTVIHVSGAIDDYAQQIFPSGSVLGGYSDGSGNGGKYIYAGGTITLLNPPAARANYISDISGNGQIAGYYMGSGSDLQPYVYRNNTFWDWAALGHPYGGAYAINDNGDTVGTEGYEFGFLVDNNVFKRLNDLVASGWNVNAGWDINASGSIAAFATQNGVKRAVLLTPGERPSPTPTATPAPTPTVSPTPVGPTPPPVPTPVVGQPSLPANIKAAVRGSWIVIPIKIADPAGIEFVNATLKGHRMKALAKSWNTNGMKTFSTTWKVRVTQKPRAGSVSEEALRKGLQLKLRVKGASRQYPVKTR